MMITVRAVRVMQVAVDDEIVMISMYNRRVPTSTPMGVRSAMPITVMGWSARGDVAG